MGQQILLSEISTPAMGPTQLPITRYRQFFTRVKMIRERSYPLIPV